MWRATCWGRVNVAWQTGHLWSPPIVVLGRTGVVMFVLHATGCLLESPTLNPLFSRRHSPTPLDDSVTPPAPSHHPRSPLPPSTPPHSLPPTCLPSGRASRPVPPTSPACSRPPPHDVNTLSLFAPDPLSGDQISPE
ncbi:hypothetical protein BJ912DRAFT_1057600 [Pholiota molesta]|nr:hypothetical protein BJ912DRAFT_1057600 [Pholiota molesta]